VFGLWFIAVARGGEPAPLSVADVVAAVRAHNPSVRGSAAAADAASGAWMTARGLFDPLYTADAFYRTTRERQFLPFLFDARQQSWTLSNGVSGVTAIGTRYQVATGLSHLASQTTSTEVGAPASTVADLFALRLDATVAQPLLRGARLASSLVAVRAAEAGWTAADLEAEAALQAGLAGALSAYWTWAGAEAEADIRAMASEVGASDVVLARAAVAAGTLAPAELARREARAAQLSAEALDARLGAEALEDGLQVAMGEDPADDRMPANAWSDPPAVTLDLVAVQEAVRASNPAVRAAEARRDQAAAVTAGARANRWVALDAVALAGVAAQDVTVGDAAAGLFDSDNLPYAQIGGQLRVPLGNRAARGELQRATGVEASRDAEIRAVSLEVEAAAALHARALASAAQRVAWADAQVSALAVALAAEEAALAAGGSHPQWVLDQRAAWIAARVEAVGARASFAAAEAALRGLRGEL